MVDKTELRNMINKILSSGSKAASATTTTTTTTDPSNQGVFSLNK
jgi:hypothetical protein